MELLLPPRCTCKPQFKRELLLTRYTKRVPKRKLPNNSLEVLLEWLEDHRHHPYPDSAQKRALVLASGLSEKQVCDYMGNWRKRKWKKEADDYLANFGGK